MAYTIIYQPLNPLPGISTKTLTEDTAASAWALVQTLHASDEKTEIKDPSGRFISWQELRDVAAREVN